ncbi:putative high mobility group B protein 11 isoform X4 [Camellia sinensis]|uniref:putative high mobility group B protein 11 isoform X4 n=1 Tax=Camellia sinensis TaxID=4442 RepID=UPI0010364EE9|nr:putative high mobility group B protein 11 isoform X4 [Camellia sinensis]
MSTHSSNEPSTITETATVYHPSHGRGESTDGQSHTNHHNHHHSNKSYPPPEALYDQIVQNPDVFLAKLKGFHDSFGTRFKVPTMGGKALDLHRLFLEVTSRGGIEKVWYLLRHCNIEFAFGLLCTVDFQFTYIESRKGIFNPSNVIKDRRWKEVISVFNFPSTITSASFVLHPASRTPVNGSAAPYVLEDGATKNQRPVNLILEPGNTVSGTIDAKFDNGYLITVKLGSEKLKGVLYHTPSSLHTSLSSNTSTVPPHRNRQGKAFMPWVGKSHQPQNWSFMEQIHRC